MQQVLARAGAACVVLACAIRAWSDTTPLPAGWSRVLGAGSVALQDAAAPFDNPAGLATSDAFSAAFGLATPGESQSAGFVAPVGAASGFGVAFERAGETSARSWALGAGRSWRAVGVGGAVTLRGGAGMAASHGATLGARLRAPGVVPGRWSAGVVVDDVARSGAPAARRVRGGVAWSPLDHGDWRATATLGASAAPDATTDVAPGFLLQHTERWALACGWSDDAMRAGAAVRHRAWTLSYTLAATDEPMHALALHVGFGATRATRTARARDRADAATNAAIDSACAAREETQVRSWLEAARAAASGGAHARAAMLYRNVLGWRPEHVEASTGLASAERAELLRRADSLTTRQELWGASGVLERAHALFPSDSLVTARLRTARAALGDADRTRNDAAQHFTAGVEAYAAQDFEAAVRAFETTLDLDPAHALAGEFLQRSRTAGQNTRHLALTEARNLLDRGELDAAAAALDRMKTKTDPEAMQLHARIDREREREREREVAARQRVEAERLAAARREDHAPAMPAPRDLAARYERGMQLYRSGDLAGALGDWEVVARHDTAYGDVGQYLLRVYRVCGLERYTEGQLQEAIALWDKALKLEPRNAQLHRYRAQAEAKLRRTQLPGGRP